MSSTFQKPKEIIPATAEAQIAAGVPVEKAGTGEAVVPKKTKKKGKKSKK